MYTFGRNVLRELREEIEWREDLEIPARSGCQIISSGVRKGLAIAFLGLVDNLPGVGYLDQPRKTEWAADNILHQTLDTRLVTRGQKHRLVDAKTKVMLTMHPVFTVFRSR